jgi:hypothetical protein
MIYTVIGKDSDGCHLVEREAQNLREAREEMRLIVIDQEYLDADLCKVEVIGQSGAVIDDRFV